MQDRKQCRTDIRLLGFACKLVHHDRPSCLGLALGAHVDRFLQPSFERPYTLELHCHPATRAHNLGEVFVHRSGVGRQPFFGNGLLSSKHLLKPPDEAIPVVQGLLFERIEIAANEVVQLFTDFRRQLLCLGRTLLYFVFHPRRPLR